MAVGLLSIKKNKRKRRLMSFIPHSLSTKQITRGQDRHDTQQWFNNKLNKCDWIIPPFVGTLMSSEVP